MSRILFVNDEFRIVAKKCLRGTSLRRNVKPGISLRKCVFQFYFKLKRGSFYTNVVYNKKILK